MFYFDSLNNKKILRSDRLKINAFFTTRGWNSDDFLTLAPKVITPNQTHSDNVRIVNSSGEYPDTDGLIIAESNTLVYLRFADCTPIIFYDSVNKIGAVSHAGWRGTAKKIGVKTINKMKDNFGTNPKDITALIGPAIGICCYEVSEEVKEECLSTVKNKEGLYKNRNIDLKQINKRQLQEAGVENIDVVKYCTSCNNDLFYSYRKENGTKNRHYAAILL